MPIYAMDQRPDGNRSGKGAAPRHQKRQTGTGGHVLLNQAAGQR
jgi:hypothetical protein